MIKDGSLGKVTHAVMQFNSSYTQAAPAEQPVPTTLDWNMWLGSAPKRPYSFARQRSWRSFYDYGGGIVTDWGVHLWDVADWYMNADNKVPASVTASGQYVRFPADKEQVPDAVIVTAQYDDFVASFTNAALPGTDFEMWGNYFFTNRGALLVNRTGYIIRGNPPRRSIPGFPEPPKPLDAKEFKNPAGMSEDPNSTFASATMNHARNFLDCVKSRQQTVCPMEVGFHSTLPCLLGLESIKRGGRAVTFDGRAVKLV
jgi:predicted dehydrogenase